MRQEFETIRQNTLMRLLRVAHWDPQSHDREGMDFALPLVGQLIDMLDAGEAAKSLGHIDRAARMLSAKFNELGYYRSVFNGHPIETEIIEECLREQLSPHFKLPPKLKIV